MVAGLFIVIARGNLIKKLVGLSILQTSVYLLYIAPGKLLGGTAPILSPQFSVYSNPLAARADPHRHRRRRRHAGARPGARGAHPRSLRQHRGRRDHHAPASTTRQHTPQDVRSKASSEPRPAPAGAASGAAADLGAAGRAAAPRRAGLCHRHGRRLGGFRLLRSRSGCRSARVASISYAIGSWPPPWGIEYRVDRLASFVLLLVSGMAALVLPWSRASIEREIPRDLHYLYYAMFGLCLTGLLGITITGDAFNIFVFLEISSLSTYVLIALGRDRRALTAAYQYLIMGSIGATFIVIGIGFLYLMTGTLNLADMALRIREVENSRPVLAALAFLTVGISLEACALPAAPVAAQRLHLRALGGHGLPRRDGDQGLGVCADPLLLHVFGESLVFDKLPLPQIMLGCR
jgi:hypothetical protein